MGITALANTGSFVFLVAASIENGSAAALDIVVAPVTIAGKMFFIKTMAGTLVHLWAAYHQRQRYRNKKEIMMAQDLPLVVRK